MRINPLRNLPLALVLPSALLVCLCLTPVVYVVVRATGVGTENGLAEAFDLIASPTSYGLLVRSLALVFVVTGASLVISLVLAFLTSVTDMPARRFWTVVSVAPFAVPCYVGASALLAASSPSGLLGMVWSWAGGERALSIQGFVPAACVLTAFTYPYAYLPIRAGFRRLDRATIDASRALGKGRLETIRRVALPQLYPSMLTGSLLVSLYTLSEFGAVSLLRYDTFTRVIYQQYTNAFDRTSAAVSSAMLIALVLVILVVYEMLTPKHASTAESMSTKARPVRVSLGVWRYPSIFVPMFVALVAVVGPVATLAIWHTRSAGETPYGASLGEQLWSSSIFGLSAAAVCLLFAVPVAMLAVRHRRLVVLFAERLTYVGFALPGIVVALGLAFFALWVKGFPGFGWVYQSFAMLLAAYVVLFVPQAIGSSRAGFARVPRSVEEAARGLGSRPAKVFSTITLPLAAPSVLAGTLLVFLSVVKELPATLLLAPTGTSTLATTVWRHMEEASYSSVAAPALTLIGLSSIVVALIVAREKLAR